MENIENCPICGQIVFSHFKNCIDYTVSKKSFEIVNCTGCSFKFTNPRPNKAKIGQYYESADYISHSNSKKGLFNLIYQTIRNRAINSKLRLCGITKNSNGHLLDIGSGTGEFLNAAKNSGWKVQGIEPGESARYASVSNYEVDVRNEDALNSLPKEHFDVITMWHVLEHVHDLNDRLEQLHSLIAKNGKVVIAVPNYTSKDAHLYGQNWAAYDVPRHLYHFSPDIIKKLFVKHGFQFVKSYPMPFDAYYVSMLSEKNSGSSLYFIKGLLNGLRSNLAAKNDPECYSSVIYTFKKAI